MSKIGFDLDQLPNCCGAYEAGRFCSGQHWCDYSADSPEEAIKQLLEESDGQPVHFNFVRNAIFDDFGDDDVTGYQDEYECNELREAVSKHPKAIHIGCFVNKNSDNIVDSWVIFDKEAPNV